ncbi:polyamine aminopropyltransferase [Streptomyces lateritius]|uniref:polyamine aminopropyltransferase n=1 Tax=Streptomyces lateritius TaxID=67313 RepID=UPI001677E4CB|nr:polyamine aminopropyltransferase [Streptomyces lateritius]GGT69639.1 polyamine aminopropyltransferase 2 [Streptomyces lateritius]
MIDPPVTVPPKRVARLPVRPRAVRYPVLAVVFVCAACGLVYELELVALASYLIGDSVTQASVVLSVMVFAMGVGSLLAKRLRCRAAVGFGLVEGGLALIGGCSALVLYAAFAWLGEARYVLVAFSLAIGVLIGAEIPLLMSLIQRAESARTYGAGKSGVRESGVRESEADEKDDPAGTVADLFAADYVGALVGGLAFPFLLLPWLGQLTGALVTGAVNAVAGGALVLWLFRYDLTARSRVLLIGANLTVLAVLGTATVLVDDFEGAARRAVYGDSVRVAVHTDLQEVVVTGERGGPPDLFVDGRLRVGGQDEHRYHESLVHPAMNGPRERVLIIGGGDGLALREVLRYAGVRSVTVVELDSGVVRLARTNPELAALNGHAYRDPRVQVAFADAFRWLRGAGADAGAGADGLYDVVVSDLPDPGISASTKLYSEEFYGLAARVLADGGRLVVHAGSASARPRTYWTVDATLRAAGFSTRAYSASGGEAARAAGPDRAERARRSGGTDTAPGDWGYVLAARGPYPPALGLAPDAPRLRSLTAEGLTSGARAAERTRDALGAEPPPSTLVHPRYGG